MPTLNKKLIANSLNILYDLLSKSANKELTSEVSAYLNLAVYKVFRYLYTANPRNPEGLFAVDQSVFGELTTAAMILSEMKIRCATAGIETDGIVPLEESERLELSPEKISNQYPLFATSLSNLIKNVETGLGVGKKQG